MDEFFYLLKFTVIHTLQTKAKYKGTKKYSMKSYYKFKYFVLFQLFTSFDLSLKSQLVILIAKRGY